MYVEIDSKQSFSTQQNLAQGKRPPIGWEFSHSQSLDDTIMDESCMKPIWIILTVTVGKLITDVSSGNPNSSTKPAVIPQSEEGTKVQISAR